MGGKRPGKRAVHVARNQNEVRLDLLHDPHQLRDHLGKLQARGTGMQLQDVVGSQVKLVEEDLRHGFVVVLPGVDQGELGAGDGVHHLAKARDLDEVGARADDDEKVHGFWSVGGLRPQCMKQLDVIVGERVSLEALGGGVARSAGEGLLDLGANPRSSSMPQRSNPQDPNKRSRSLSRAPPAIKGRPVARYSKALPGIVRRPVSLLF